MRVETREERLERRRRERAEQVAYKLEQEIAVWDPAGISNVTADPFKTLFVARIVSSNYTVYIVIIVSIIICTITLWIILILINFCYRITTLQNLN